MALRVDPGAFGGDGRWRSAPSRLDSDPEAHLLSKELRGRLLEAVDELAPAQRAVITLRDLGPGRRGGVLAAGDQRRQPAGASASRSSQRARRAGSAGRGGRVMRLWRATTTIGMRWCAGSSSSSSATISRARCLPDEKARFEAHLAECDGCAGYLEDMRRMVDSMSDLPEPPVDAAHGMRRCCGRFRTYARSSNFLVSGRAPVRRLVDAAGYAADAEHPQAVGPGRTAPGRSRRRPAPGGRRRAAGGRPSMSTEPEPRSATYSSCCPVLGFVVGLGRVVGRQVHDVARRTR